MLQRSWNPYPDLWELVGENLNLDCFQLSLFVLTASCFSVWFDGGPSTCSTLRFYDTESFSLVPLHLPKRGKIYQTKLLLLSNVNKDWFVMLNLTLNRKKNKNLWRRVRGDMFEASGVVEWKKKSKLVAGLESLLASVALSTTEKNKKKAI